jgi:hypothetical protein
MPHKEALAKGRGGGPPRFLCELIARWYALGGCETKGTWQQWWEYFQGLLFELYLTTCVLALHPEATQVEPHQRLGSGAYAGPGTSGEFCPWGIHLPIWKGNLALRS